MMNTFDPLDWLHQWDDFEMMMYTRTDEGTPGIYMQASRKVMRDGAEEWEMLYDRRIADVDADLTVEEPVGSDLWEERVLRHHLNTHPQLVAEEKVYVNEFLAEHGNDQE